jgi:predicted nucleic acid-binding protein
MVRFAQQLQADQRPAVTTDDVLNEVVALLTTDSRGIARSKLIQFIIQIRSSPQVHIVHVDEQIWSEAWSLLERMSDKSWSWVVASSFVVMRRLGITEAFTSDHHFTQAGFVRVPLP